MDTSQEFETAIALALKLSPTDRLRLVEQVVASVEQEISQTHIEGHWGQHIVDLLETLDFDEWSNLEGDDPVEWVQQMRHNQASHRDLDWGEVE